MSFDSLALPAAAVRWRLDGPAGAHTDLLVASLIGAGVLVESITPTQSYRLDGPRLLLDALAAELSELPEFTLRLEPTPEDTIQLRTDAALAFPYARTLTVHGRGAATTMVARAIDRHLIVTTAGMNRWVITGRTTGLVDWVAAVLAKTTEEAQALLGLTPERVAAEDAPMPVALPPIKLTLPSLAVKVTDMPDRHITTEITRDTRSGEIVQVVQHERDEP